MAWTFFRASAESAWPSLLGCAPSPTAKSTSTLVACSCRGWPTVNCNQHRYGTTLSLFDPRTSPNPSTSSPAVFPARTSALLALVSAWQASEAGFIAKSSASLASFDRDSCSWKTSQPSDDPQAWLSETWPRSGMTVDGQLSPLPTLVHPIGAIDGGSLLPTPTASDYGSSQNGINSTRPSAGTLSISARDSRGQAGKLWPTPTVADARASARATTSTEAMHAGESLTDALRSETGKKGDVLSPRFVEWMMGYAEGWTDLEHWATP